MYTEMQNSGHLDAHPLWITSPLSDDTIAEYYCFARELAIEVGGLLREGYYREREIASKSQRELVTSVDIAAERLIRARINSKFPEHKILSEELGQAQKYDVPDLWIVDPLDGTNNFAHGFPIFSVSIAFVHQGHLELGVVYDPLREELFAASSRDAAYLNGHCILVSGNFELSQSLLATGFPYDRAPENDNNLNYFISFLHAAQGIRRPGSASLDLCYVAAGRLDGFWELKLRPWDMAAGALIAQKAGARVTDFNGNPWILESDRIVAANPKIHEQMMAIFKGHET